MTHPIAVSASRVKGRILNAITVDVEDYFQVQALAHRIPRSAWNDIPTRVERNVDQILELFDAAGAHGTFFTLGWIAERHQSLIVRIASAGHEIASHGFDHTRVDQLTADEFREDIRRSKRLIEDIAGLPVNGYRAPTFSIGRHNRWAFEVLEQEGYIYSSSLYPIRHDLYGVPDAPRVPFQPGPGNLWEIPMTTRPLWGRNYPCAGGGYFRLLPYWWSRWHLEHINGVDGSPCMFYFHPWELDYFQPRIKHLGWRSRFRHYTNLGKMTERLTRLLGDFRWGRVDEAFAFCLDGGAPVSVDTARW